MSEEFELSEKTRDILRVATFIGVLFLIAYTTGNPDYGLQDQEVLQQVSHGNTNWYGGQHTLPHSYSESEVVCTGNVAKRSLPRTFEGEEIVALELSEGEKCVYPETVEKIYFELYGHKVLL